MVEIIEQQHHKNTLDIAILQKELDQIRSFFDRFDKTIDKMGEINSNISKIVAVQENKIAYQDRKLTDYHNLINIVKVQNEDQSKKIECLSNELINIKNNFEKINRYIDTQETKIKKLENWKWWITGGLSAIGVFLAYFFKKFF